MRKPKNNSKDKYTASEVGSLIEQLRSEFHIFGEDMVSVKEDVKATKKMVAKNTEDITFLKITVKNLTAKIEALTEKVNKNTEAIAVLGQKIDKNTEAIAALTKSIDNLAKTKIDREEFKALEGRVGVLEAKVAALSK